jgi:hypothetical protein
MSMKRMFVILGVLLILGVGFGIASQQNPAQEKNRAQEKNKVRNGIKGDEKTPLQNRLMFRDENGDGICDSFRDHDNDGIPNGQDPDWTGARDGKGNQSRYGSKNSDNTHGIRKERGGNNTWNNRTFRQNRANGGKGLSGRNSSGCNVRKGGKK